MWTGSCLNGILGAGPPESSEAGGMRRPIACCGAAAGTVGRACVVLRAECCDPGGIHSPSIAQMFYPVKGRMEAGEKSHANMSHYSLNR